MVQLVLLSDAYRTSSPDIYVYLCLCIIKVMGFPSRTAGDGVLAGLKMGSKCLIGLTFCRVLYMGLVT